MAVPTVLSDLTVSEGTNSPLDSESVTPTTRPSDYLRAHASIIRRMRAQGAALASAATVNIGAITDGEYIHITGVVTITSFDTIAAGVLRTLVFDGVLILTHNATSLILPAGGSITTKAGDVAVFVSEGAGNWRCTSYSPLGVGMGQTWQNLTASRALETTYTNNTGKPISVTVIVSNTALGTRTTLSLNVGVISINWDEITSAATGYASVTGIVPNGVSYVASAVNGTLNTYAELR